MKIKILCATAIALVIRQAVAAESELQFNPAFLNGERANSADLAWVNAGSALPPGEYNLNVYINTQFAFTGNVTFRVAERPLVKPCRALRLHNSPHLASTAVRLKGVSCRLRSAAFF